MQQRHRLAQHVGRLRRQLHQDKITHKTFCKHLQSASGYLKLVDINYKSETEETVNFESCRLKRAQSSGYYLDTNRRRVKCVRSLCVGELLKRGMSKLKTWRTRSFKLHLHLVAEVGELEYYSGSTLKGSFVFTHKTYVSPIEDKNGRPFCFTVISTANDKTLYASARNDQDRAHWVARLRDVIQMLQTLAANSAKPAFKSISSMSGRVTFFARDMLSLNLCRLVEREAGLRESGDTDVKQVSVRVDGQCELLSLFGRAFHTFRRQCGFSDSDLLSSLSDRDWVPLSDDLVFQSDKASYKYATADRRVLVVVLRGEEYLALHLMLHSYFRYMSQNVARSFLPKIFGMFELRSADRETKQFIICVKNPIITDLQIHQRYECTHCFYARLFGEYRPENFVDVGANRPQVLQQLRRDTDFLSRSGVAEYRLLLWVHASEHPLQTTEKLQAQLRRRCWDQYSNDWCPFHGGFLSLNNDGTFRVSFLTLWDIFSACSNGDRRRSSSTRLSLRGSAAKAETVDMPESKAESYQAHLMRMVEREVFPSCPVTLHLANRDERRFLLRCLKHRASLQVHMRANQLLLPAHACRELGAGSTDNPFEDTGVGDGLAKYIDPVP